MFTFLKEVREELSKVVWPTQKEVINYTITVIVFSVVVSAILGAADFGFLKLFQVIVGK